MPLHFSKSDIAVGFAGALAGFVVASFVTHSSALPVPVPTVAASAAAAVRVADAAPTPQASAQPAQPGNAHTPDRQAGPRAACQQDVRQLCGDVTPGAGRIVQCLAQHRSEISESCRSAMQQRQMERRQQRQSMREWRQTNGAASGHAPARMQPSARIITVPDAQPSSSIEE
jgi:Cysteine rich repeat